jgi:hypothetical protein
MEEQTVDEISKLRKVLHDKTDALESAKMIITSLEHASGSLAVDMRTKLKAKEEELTRVKAEALTRQKSLDSMALELRESRRAQAARHKAASEERNKVFSLTSRLERNIYEIRESSVVLEATQDASAVATISDLLCESIAVLKEGIKIDYVDDGSEEPSATSETSISRDNKRLKRELDEKTAASRRLEEEFKQVREENRQTRVEAESAHRRHEVEMQSLWTEVQNLKRQYSTKERELAVLRDSLKVDDDGGGYISDDASEADEDDDSDSPALTPPPHLYGTSPEEALATLLAHGDPSEVEALKCKLVQTTVEAERGQKQLKIERESLTNAKMIISSLEIANKSMMEDLRSRLQDSNSAIASLLEKSVGSENTTAQLRFDFETLKREKNQEKEKYKMEIDRLRCGVGGWSAFSTDHLLMEEKKDDMITETID